MVRREIKSFVLECALGALTLDAPFSLAAAINVGRLSLNDVEDSVTFTAEIEADAIALSIKNIFIKLGRFSAPCDVLLNGNVIGHVDGERISYVFDASGSLTEGKNKLSFRFDTACDLRTVGIFAPVEIVRFNNAIIDKVSLTESHSEDTVTLGIHLDMLGNTENVRAVATLTSSSGQMYYAGLTRGNGSITVSDPLYWWPHGHGVQNLYKLTVNLYGDVDIEDTAEMRIGLRTVEAGHTDDGYAVKINGIKILPMGAVYRAEPDLSLPKAEKRVEAFVTYAAMSNYNTLVIPADSPRPSERFYDLCDLHGIMVIEETNNLGAGYLDTLSRIAHHPSLCHLDVLDSGDVLATAESLAGAAPQLGFTAVTEFTKYPAHPSLPCEKTINAQIGKPDKNPTSPEMERLCDTETLGKILCGVIEKYPYPKNAGDLSYVSQLASANKILREIKEARITEAKTNRAIFDCLGDTDATASSSAIDSDVRRKALGFYTHKAFAPIALYADYEDGKVVFTASSQKKLNLEGTLEYRIADAKNVTIYKNTEEVELDGMEVKTLTTASVAEYICGHENEYYLEYTLREGTTVIATDVLLFVPEKHFEFKNPEIECEISGSDKKFSITVAAKAFAKDVELYFEGADAVFSGNYLNLTQPAPVKITFNITSGSENTLHLREMLRVRSIYDVK